MHGARKDFGLRWAENALSEVAHTRVNSSTIFNVCGVLLEAKCSLNSSLPGSSTRNVLVGVEIPKFRDCRVLGYLWRFRNRIGHTDCKAVVPRSD